MIISAGLTVLVLLSMAVCYGFFREPNHVRLRTIVVQSGGLADHLAGKRAVLISDLHIGSRFHRAAAEALRMISELKPDLIFLTGDYVQWNGKTAAYENALDFMSRLKAPLGVYAVFGDSDYSFSRKSCEFCHEAGGYGPVTRHSVKFFKNSGKYIETDKGRVFIAGIDAGPGLDEVTGIASLLPKDAPVILLAHSSVIFDSIDTGTDTLVLSGDTHGGQVLLPEVIWKLIKRKPDPEHMHGFFQERKKALYVTSGIGTSHLPFRLGVPPEVVVIQFGDKGRTGHEDV